MRGGALVLLAALVASCSGDDSERSAPSAVVSSDTASLVSHAGSEPVSGTVVSAAASTTMAMGTTGDGFSLAEQACPQGHPARARCATLTVAADASDPSAGTVELPVTVLPATGPSVAPDPLVVPGGGPGAAAADELGWAGSPWNASRDIVLYDQRGTGRAVPSLDCPELDGARLRMLQQPGSYLEERDQLALERNRCLQRLTESGIDLGDYHTEASATDLDALRRALGYDRWNILGISYGARLALATMRSYPDGIRSVVLDSVYDVTSGGLAAEVAAGERAFAHLNEVCAATPECAATYGDLDVLADQVRQRYNTSPATITADSGDGTGAFTLTGDDILGGTHFAMLNAALIPEVPRLLALWAAGDTTFLSFLVENMLSFSLAEAMATAVDCADNAGLGRAAADAAVYDDPGRYALLIAVFGSCPPDWPATPGAFNQPVTSEIPALLLAGGFDPTTPPDGTRAVADGVTNSTFVLVEAGSHFVGAHDGCTIGLVTAFLDDPTTDPDIACTTELPPVTFSQLPTTPTTEIDEQRPPSTEPAVPTQP